MFWCMRTTVNIQDHLLHKAKEEALRKNRTLGEFIEDAIRCNLERHSRAGQESNTSRPLKTFSGDGLRPGVDLNDSAALSELMDRN